MHPRLLCSFCTLIVLLLFCGRAQAQGVYQQLKSFGFPQRAGANPSSLMPGRDDLLYGITPPVGDLNGGTIFKVNKDGTDYGVVYAFGWARGYAEWPVGTLAQGTNGTFYGVTSSGGESFGAVYRVEPNGSGYEVLHIFGVAVEDVYRPNWLILGSDSVLYGTAGAGGEHGEGGVFRLNVDGTNYRLLWSFGGQAGSPRGQSTVVEGSDGALYGTRPDVVFRLGKDGSGYAVLRTFTGPFGGDGYGCMAPLTEGEDGTMYGTTSVGGEHTSGTVFKLKKDGSNYELLHSFAPFGGDGRNPQTPVVEGSDGYLYGTTVTGGAGYWDRGTIYRMATNGTQYEVLRTFSGQDGDGAELYAGLIDGGDGVFYGITYRGGNRDGGILFSFAEDGFTYRILHSFSLSGSDGENPRAGLVEASDGRLYGLCYQGGTLGAGTIFGISKDGSGYRILDNFSPWNGEGFHPDESLIEGSDGRLYGVTTKGGTNDSGTVFTIATNATDHLVLHSLTQTALGVPSGRLVEGNDGSLYGTSSYGGAHGFGSIYKLNKDGDGYVLLYSLDGTEGKYPLAGLIQGQDGFLYGTTVLDGGTVFKVSTSGSGFAVLHTFSGSTDGYTPGGPVIQASDGRLYGTTQSGGADGRGTVFALNPDGSGYEVVHHLSVDDGYSPYGGVIEGTDGMLYATTSNGPWSFFGTLVRMNKDGSDFAVLHHFGSVGADGRYPLGALVEGNDGALYGTTHLGGEMNYGTVFRFEPTPRLSLAMTKDGARLRFSGTGDRAWETQRAARVDGPWETVAVRQTVAYQTIEHTDAGSPAGSSFYRLRLVSDQRPDRK